MWCKLIWKQIEIRGHMRLFEVILLRKSLVEGVSDIKLGLGIM